MVSTTSVPRRQASNMVRTTSIRRAILSTVWKVYYVSKQELVWSIQFVTGQGKRRNLVGKTMKCKLTDVLWDSEGSAVKLEGNKATQYASTRAYKLTLFLRGKLFL